MATDSIIAQLPARDLTVAIQAGGQSSRMGRDKSFVPLNGRPLIKHVIERVEGLGSELLVVTNNSEGYEQFGLPLVNDIYPGRGPLAGIHTSLHHGRNPYVLVVACDMPWLQHDLLAYMIAQRETADIIVPLWDRFPEPLHAIYSKTCLGPIENNLAAGRLKITRFFGQVNARYLRREEIEQIDPDGRSFANINTPDDLDDLDN